MLVVSAHAADFVWRAGGTIAKYIRSGSDVYIIILSFGVRGESNDLWKHESSTADYVEKIRREEVSAAANILRAENIECWDFEDYPMEITRERIDRLSVRIREIRPDIVLTHDRKDAFNPDHEKVSRFVFQSTVIANSAGAQLDGLNATKQMSIFGFEPHQTEISDFTPGTFIDITDAFDVKKQAMECFKAQKHLIEYYTMRARMRGNHAARISGNKDYRYAECFANFFPIVGEKFR